MKKILFILTLVLTTLLMSSAAFSKLYSPVYRLYNPTSLEHLYTTSNDEVIELVEKQGWKNEDVAFVSENKNESPSPEKIDVIYRIFNPKSGEHLYTIDLPEIETLKNSGWTVDFNGVPCFYSSTNHEDEGEVWLDY